MYYLIDMHNGYKFIGKFKSEEELKREVFYLLMENGDCIPIVYTEKCRGKKSIGWH